MNVEDDSDLWQQQDKGWIRCTSTRNQQNFFFRSENKTKLQIEGIDTCKPKVNNQDMAQGNTVPILFKIP